MRKRVSAGRSRFLRQTALVAVLGAVAAGCSEVSRFETPFFTGSTENQREIIGNSQPMPPPVATSAVARYDLPPPTASAAVSSNAQAVGLPPGDYKWTPTGVQPVSAVAASYNAVPAAYNRPQQPAPSARNVHVVAEGETLYAIGRRYNVHPNDIVTLNGLSSLGKIRSGQRLQIPGGGTAMVATMNPSAPQSISVAAQKVAAPAPAVVAAVAQPFNAKKPVVSKPEMRAIAGVPSIPAEPVAARPAVSAPSIAAVDTAIEPPSTDGTSFRWPVRGRIIADFGVKPGGQRNDGINLAVPEGTTVKAAEAGSVIYAGNELPGYGNLVLVRHADDWVSAYAHNSAIRVKRGDQIRRGQTLATAGMSGSVSSPQVHFELRKKAKPVNPLDYLAGA